MSEREDPGLAEHRRSCVACIVGANAQYYEAPQGLEEKIRERLPREISLPWKWMAIAASVLLAASLTWNISTLRSRVADDLVSAHIRSLSGTHLLDVPSSDHHTVKPWFNGKLDFSPAVKEVEGFPLLGGRIEYFEGHPAAALVYSRRNHVINLFTWPGEGAGAARTVHGYHVVGWVQGGMEFGVVSDLNEEELLEFVRLYRM